MEQQINSRDTAARHPYEALGLDELAAAAEFDAAYYLTQVDGITPGAAFRHFLEVGWRQGIDPSPLFSISAYVEMYPDVRERGVNPFLHFVNIGRYEGRRASPSNELHVATRSASRRSLDRPDVCFVTEELPGSTRSGGIGTAVSELMDLCAERDVPATIIWCPPGDASERDVADGEARWHGLGHRLEVVDLGAVANRNMPQFRSLAVYKHLRDRDLPPLSVYFPDYAGLGYHSIAAKRLGVSLGRTNLGLHLHGPTRWVVDLDGVPFEHVSQLVRDQMERYCAAHADRVTSVSKYMVDWYVARGLLVDGDPRVTVIRNRVGKRRSSEVPPHYRTGPRPLVVIAHAGPRKGLQTAIRAMDLLRNKSMVSDLIFVGRLGFVDNVPTPLYIEERLAKAGSSQWMIVDGANRFEVQDLLQSLDDPVVLVPSAAENLPFAVLEPAVLGLQTISSLAGGGPEPFDKVSRESGLFFIPDDPRSIAEAISTALDHPEIRLRFDDDHSTVDQAWVDELTVAVRPEVALGSSRTEPPSVTVALTHFNRPAKLLTCVKTFTNAGYEGNLDIVVVDDGSTPTPLLGQVRRIIEDLGVRWIDQPNRYLGAARNRALREARTEYILFFDDDDIPSRQIVTALARAAGSTGADIVAAYGEDFLESNRHLVLGREPEISSQCRWVPLGGPISVAPRENLLGGAVTLQRVSACRELGGFTEDYGVGYEDFEILVRAINSGCRVEAYPEPLFHYEKGKPSMLTAVNPSRSSQRVLRAFASTDANSMLDLASLVSGEAAADVARMRQVPEGTSPEYLSALTDFRAEDPERRLAAARQMAGILNLAGTQTAIDRGTLLLSRVRKEVRDSAAAATPDPSILLTMNLRGWAEALASDPLRLTPLSAAELELFGQVDWSESEFLGEQLDSLLHAIVRGATHRSPSENVGAAFVAARVAQICGTLRQQTATAALLVRAEESVYLARYPDVRARIPTWHPSGIFHFYRYGLDEGREGFSSSLALARRFASATGRESTIEILARLAEHALLIPRH